MSGGQTQSKGRAGQARLSCRATSKGGARTSTSPTSIFLNSFFMALAPVFMAATCERREEKEKMLARWDDGRMDKRRA